MSLTVENNNGEARWYWNMRDGISGESIGCGWAQFQSHATGQIEHALDNYLDTHDMERHAR